jgi:predicted AAA+ superfamily ATPase
LGDTGVACALLGVDAAALWADRTLLGQLLETFIFQELHRQASWRDDPITFYHFRDKDGVEVDIVLEGSGQRIAGVEVKASATVTARDFRGLRKLKESAGVRFAGGVVLYDGEVTAPFGDQLYAVPIRRLWEGI